MYAGLEQYSVDRPEKTCHPADRYIQKDWKQLRDYSTKFGGRACKLFIL